jgi:hypothetical protein
MKQSDSSARFYLGLWAVYPLLVPFYLLGKTPVPGQAKVEGGVPQPADYYLVLLMGLIFTGLPVRLLRSAWAMVWAFAALVVWTALVNLVWATVLEDLSLLKNTLFYAYDAALFVTCVMLYSAFGDRFLKVTVWSVGASVVLQALLSPLAPPQAFSRQAAFFNNENQLGYFCVLCATIFVLGAKRYGVPFQFQALVYGAIGYLTFISQCRSALLGLGVLLVIALLEHPLRLLLVLAALAAVALPLTLTPPMVGKGEERLVVGGEYDTPGARGYDRFVNYPEHILLGAGEGAYERFRSDLYGSELHSSYGTLLFCYGIPGTLLFTLGLLLVCRGNGKAALFLTPALLHGVVHQGLRFAFFWAMLGFLGCLTLELMPKQRKTAEATGAGVRDERYHLGSTEGRIADAPAAC